jgi:hypothetical protein
MNFKLSIRFAAPVIKIQAGKIPRPAIDIRGNTGVPSNNHSRYRRLTYVDLIPRLDAPDIVHHGDGI